MENQITQAAQAICAAFQKGGKLLLCGNGGSAADCAHITGELVKGFLKKRPLAEDLKARIGTPWAEKLQGGLPALDLTANSALIAAVINDLDGLNAYASRSWPTASRETCCWAFPPPAIRKTCAAP